MEALAGGRPLTSVRARQVTRSREELLGLLADFGDGDSDGRELSFTDLVDVVVVEAKPGTDGAHHVAVEKEQEKEAAPKQQQQAAAVAAREKRLRRRRSDSRGSCGGSGDGVLLNFYVPGLLTRSMTAPRPGRGAPATAAAAAGKARVDAPPAAGCWPALWGRGGGRRKPVKPTAERRDTGVLRA